MALFQVDPAWESFNTDLARQVIEAAEELSSLYLPPAVYDIQPPATTQSPQINTLQQFLALSKTPSNANRLIREHLSTNYKSCYFLHVIAESEKGAAAVLEWLALNANSSTDFETTRVEFQRIAEEQALRRRTLFEALVSAISFSAMGSAVADMYIEHYVAYHTYDHYRKMRNEYYASFDLSTFTAPAPIPVDGLLDAVANRITAIEGNPQFDFNMCWYLRRTRAGFARLSFTSGSSYPALPNELLDAAGRLSFVLNQGQNSGLDALEKSVLGFTYQTLYGATSHEIHFAPDLHLDYFLTSPSFQRSLATVNMLSACLASRCLIMTSVPDSSVSRAQALFDTIAGPETQPIYQSVVGKPQAVVGDYVAAQPPTGTLVGEVLAMSVHPTTHYVLYQIQPFSVGVNPRPQPVIVRSIEVIAIFASAHVAQIAQEYRDRTTSTVAMSTSLTFLFGTRDNFPLLEEIAENLGAIKHGAAKMRFAVSQ
ncbi:MAG: hypothetical protein IPP97_26695 [Candidatus Obscuribacter sp.]|nr:hypothetical protein [Candidatus Obscuribacter sp.]